ncbi:ribulose 1,5-bisphosphate synthetase/thiazole synthase [Streptomyces collinus]|uniref:Ribulose 1,5-bisphosphate synthetase/thiazole synthase n=1 Tax=Streptomyces collinus TaxID=42684 RepID=A0AA89PXB5_STRCU|nr:ribulose 1,5-bisphosphate synthetase/thiazole synthase [Streptomyces collinus]
MTSTRGTQAANGQWSRRADLVVIGAGPAGLTAA